MVLSSFVSLYDSIWSEVRSHSLLLSEIYNRLEGLDRFEELVKIIKEDHPSIIKQSPDSVLQSQSIMEGPLVKKATNVEKDSFLGDVPNMVPGTTDPHCSDRGTCDQSSLIPPINAEGVQADHAPDVKLPITSIKAITKLLVEKAREGLIVNSPSSTSQGLSGEPTTLEMVESLKGDNVASSLVSKSDLTLEKPPDFIDLTKEAVHLKGFAHIVKRKHNQQIKKTKNQKNMKRINSFSNQFLKNLFLASAPVCATTVTPSKEIKILVEPALPVTAIPNVAAVSVALTSLHITPAVPSQSDPSAVSSMPKDNIPPAVVGNIGWAEEILVTCHPKIVSTQLEPINNSAPTILDTQTVCKSMESSLDAEPSTIPCHSLSSLDPTYPESTTTLIPANMVNLDMVKQLFQELLSTNSLTGVVLNPTTGSSQDRTPTISSSSIYDHPSCHLDGHMTNIESITGERVTGFRPVGGLYVPNSLNSAHPKLPNGGSFNGHEGPTTGPEPFQNRNSPNLYERFPVGPHVIQNRTILRGARSTDLEVDSLTQFTKSITDSLPHPVEAKDPLDTLQLISLWGQDMPICLNSGNILKIFHQLPSLSLISSYDMERIFFPTQGRVDMSNIILKSRVVLELIMGQSESLMQLGFEANLLQSNQPPGKYGGCEEYSRNLTMVYHPERAPQHQRRQFMPRFNGNARNWAQVTSGLWK
ncbi:uncharacterized protein [Ambystoma mexicanum]|uniref:uncharacterized protein n=1 Tax=Ambystoma mexicanum TaxID=8296 RepID=UPI0037E842C3